MQYGTIIETKLANALFADAEVRKGVPNVTSGDLARFKARNGGLWVGGTVTLTDTHLLFDSNALNDAVHTDSHAFAIPLLEITKVAVEFGWFTRIVAVSVANETYRFRCFGAAAFAAKIREAAKLA